MLQERAKAKRAKERAKQRALAKKQQNMTPNNINPDTAEVTPRILEDSYSNPVDLIASPQNTSVDYNYTDPQDCKRNDVDRNVRDLPKPGTSSESNALEFVRQPQGSGKPKMELPKEDISNNTNDLQNRYQQKKMNKGAVLVPDTYRYLIIYIFISINNIRIINIF